MSDKSRNISPNIARRLPFAPPPNSVRALRVLVRLRSVLAWCCVGGLSAATLMLFLFTVPALKDYVLLPMLAFTVCWIGGSNGMQFVDSRLEQYLWSRFRVDHIRRLTYWNDGILSRDKLVSLPWPLAGLRLRERMELLKQLPLLTEDTAYIVCDSERHSLYKMLYGQDAELICAVLRAVPVLGDARALPSLLHLAEGNGLAATNRAVRAEARSSLSRLQAILDLSSGSRGLLRASSAPQTSEEHLLHPVQGKRETDPRELLRADVQIAPANAYQNEEVS